MISHGTSGNLSSDTVAEIQQVYGAATAPAAPRAEDGIARLFGGLEMVSPGLCDAAVWRAGPGAVSPGSRTPECPHQGRPRHA